MSTNNDTRHPRIKKPKNRETCPGNESKIGKIDELKISTLKYHHFPELKRRLP